MLKRLFIKDFILIEELELNFHSGFSVFTGETGAGKSVFIDCISILIGERMNTSMIRVNCDSSVIEGEFAIDAEIGSVLKTNGYSADRLVISRQISRDGKSTARVNGKNATLAFIRELIGTKVDIHCQRDNQYLLNESNHISLLDKYACLNDELIDLKARFSRYRELSRQYQNLLENEFNEAQIEIIRYQIDEIEKLNLREGEEEEISSAIRAFSQREKVTKLLESLRDIFDSDNGVLAGLYQFNKLSGQLESFEGIEESSAKINDAYYSISEEYSNIVSYFDNIDLDLSDIDAMNQRLYDIQRIKRKYNSSVRAILEKREELKNQLDLADNRQNVLDDLQKQIDESYRDFEKMALLIRERRRKEAKNLENEVVGQLQDLNLEKAQFMVEISEASATALGLDAVRFLLSMNPGQPLRSLSNVASGGELSRLMLGLKNIFAQLQNTELAIFDEIDTGVSGYVAFNMGLKMHSISRNMQVFSVTHLAAVAAHSDYHYRIEKLQQSDSTRTHLKLLNKEERIEELAVLSSSNVSEASLTAARELLENAKKAENNEN